MKKKKKKQSQKRYMVSGFLYPLISFLDVSYSVNFVVRGQRPIATTYSITTKIDLPHFSDFYLTSEPAGGKGGGL